MKVVKRNGSIVDFDASKIENAILKAMKNGSGIVKERIAHSVANEIEEESKDRGQLKIEDIEALVFNKLISKKQRLTAQSYEGFRSVREFQRNSNNLDDKINGIIKGSADTINDNSNKDVSTISTMRDLVAEEVSKDIALRSMLPSHIAHAHNEGLIYIHDLGHYLNPSFNCCLLNLEDMLNNGTVINKKFIAPQKRFSTACTVTSQIVAQVASGQFGL